jgi:hypothetical protein
MDKALGEMLVEDGEASIIICKGGNNLNIGRFLEAGKIENLERARRRGINYKGCVKWLGDFIYEDR